MWNAPDKPIPAHQINDHYFSVLEDALESENPWTDETEEALKHFEALCLRTGGFTLFREGLRTGDRGKMVEGYRLIRKHLGA